MNIIDPILTVNMKDGKALNKDKTYRLKVLAKTDIQFYDVSNPDVIMGTVHSNCVFCIDENI